MIKQTDNSRSTHVLRRLVFAFVILMSVTLLNGAIQPGIALAEDPVNSYFFGGAIKGYDPVSYHTQGKAEEGSRKFTHEWNGATWRFASSANRDLFVADPERYAPQYGGYCAWAMADGKFVGVDPERWSIVDGKLYLNYNQDIQDKWKKDIPSFIEKADRKYAKRITK